MLHGFFKLEKNLKFNLKQRIPLKKTLALRSLSFSKTGIWNVYVFSTVRVPVRKEGKYKEVERNG